MIIQIPIYLLTEAQKNQIVQINNETKNYAVICNYGTGDCISADIDTTAGFEQHASYIKSQAIEISEVDVEDEDEE
jgi:hypothetical protein